MGLWDSFCGDTSLHGYQYIGRFGHHYLIIYLLNLKEGEEAVMVLNRISQHRACGLLPLVQHCRVSEQV